MMAPEMGAMGREKRQKGERRFFLKDLSKAILVIFQAEQISEVAESDK